MCIRDRFRATGGVNTHKGAVFTLGTVCAAAGRLWTVEGFSKDLEDVYKRQFIPGAERTLRLARACGLYEGDLV